MRLDVFAGSVVLFLWHRHTILHAHHIITPYFMHTTKTQGHMVPWDQPENSLASLDAFVNNQPLSPSFTIAESTANSGEGTSTQVA